MFYPDNDLPCASCAEVRFHAVDDRRSAGFLECGPARVAVEYACGPQPHLVTRLPLLLPASAGAVASFLAACRREGDDRWFNFEASPASGQISWRRDLVFGDAAETDAALREMRGFFAECWPWLERAVERCGDARREGGFRAFLRTLLEA